MKKIMKQKSEVIHNIDCEETKGGNPQNPIFQEAQKTKTLNKNKSTWSLGVNLKKYQKLYNFL